jgi:hypothetical protein
MLTRSNWVHLRGPSASTRNLLLAKQIRREAVWSVVYLWQKACKNGNSDWPRDN